MSLTDERWETALHTSVSFACVSTVVAALVAAGASTNAENGMSQVRSVKRRIM